MKAQPAERDLLDIALKTLTGDLMPRLSGEDRYLALIIASALGTVGRELADDGRSDITAGHLLGAVYGEDRGKTVRDLSRDIRDGKLDGSPDTAERLFELARIRCELSNPKAAASYLE